jgi:DNA (cytosine-5)-methyltransferase 1
LWYNEDMRKRLTLGSLFSGIGSCCLGFERAGFKVKWTVEIDPFCRKILAKNFPNAERFEDVNNVGIFELSPVDVLSGGFPCQDISLAGPRLGLAGKRSGLWSEFYRIIGELRPKYVLVENVQALLGRGMLQVLGDLSEIGYDAEWEVIQAAEVGLPQARKRVWIIAYPSGERKQRLFEGFDFSEVRQGWSGSPEDLQSISDLALVGSDSFPQPLLWRVDERPSHWVDRIHGLGNTVVPQIPEWIARRIREYEEGSNG